MTTRTKETSALAELETLREKVREAKARVAAVEAERRTAGRKLAVAENRLRVYFESIETGEEGPDPEREGTLRTAIAEARDAAADPAFEGRASGALRVVADRENAVNNFARERQSDLVAELTVAAKAARDRLFAARDELYAASGEWSGVSVAWRGLVEQWGLSPADVPRHPLAGDVSTALEELFAPFASGVRRDPRRFLPMPSSLAPEEGDE